MENKIRKLDASSFKNISTTDTKILNTNEDNKFPYKSEFYSKQSHRINEIYEEYNMSDYRINQIPFRIGYPYLFRHIDYCDHMVILSDVRLSDKYDKFVDEEKCVVTYQKKLKRRICDTCAFYYAKFISINDPIGGVNNKVIFICEFCLKKLHDKEVKENTLSTIKLIPYFHD